MTGVKAFLREWGLHLGYAVGGAAIGLLAVIYIASDDDPPPREPKSAESRFIKPKALAPVLPVPRQEPQQVEALPPSVPSESETAATLQPPEPEPIPQAGIPLAWQKHAVAYAAPAGKPLIAVVIDDMGIDRSRTAEVTALPGPLTTSFLTYAGNLKAQVLAAQRAGHELLVHVPMEPSGKAADPGPNAITTGLAQEEMKRRLDWALARFPDFVGINNHMGSRFTADRDGMVFVLSALKQRGLLFLDSRTTAETVAASVARDLDLPFVERHVFLDDDPSATAVARQLREVERIAARDGYAVVIGHPKDATIDALRHWLPALARRGFALVPVSAIAEFRQRQGRG